LSHFEEDEQIPCPDCIACHGMVFAGKSHFKHHAARIHSFVL
jgi:hypothetical protein